MFENERLQNMIKSIKNNIYFLKYMFAYSKSYVIGEALVAVIEGVMPLLDIMIPKMMIDSLIDGGSFQTIIFYIMLYVLLSFSGEFFSGFLTENYINLNGHLYSMHFLLMINRKKVDLDMAQLDDPRVHQQIALAEDLIYKGIGIDMINNFFTAITSVVSIAATAAVLVYANVYLLFVIFIFACFSAVFHLKMENWQLAQRDENIYLTRVLNYYIKIMGEKSCTKEMRLYGFAEWLMKKYRRTLEVLRGRLKKLYHKSLQIRTIGILLETVKNNGIYLYLAWLAFRRKITVGEFSQYFNASSQFSESILEFAAFLMNININGKYIDSFRDFMELESETHRQDTENGRDKFDQAVKSPLKLSMSHVDFRYKGSEHLVLHDISYTFEQGKVYLIVGENGAGKTTLIQLLCHLYQPCGGNICLNGISIDAFPDADYKKLFSVVFQDFQYFAFTIGENVALDVYSKEDKEVQEQILQVLGQAGLKEKVDSLPDGIHTNLDKIFYDNGVVLSGGENQKLAFARALFHHAKILILDEPSSALDPVAEDELLKAFQKIARDKIVIYISHRLSSAVLADEILFLKEGRLWESGSHKELMQKNGAYAEYYHTQAKYYQE